MPTDREQTQSSCRASVYVRLHVLVDADPERLDDDDYMLDLAADAIYRNDVLDSTIESVDAP